MAANCPEAISSGVNYALTQAMRQQKNSSGHFEVEAIGSGHYNTQENTVSSTVENLNNLLSPPV
jgi:hypothetical protein